MQKAAMLNIHELKEKLFELTVFRIFIATCIFLRGTSYLLMNNIYKGVSDYCWIYRVSDIKLFQNISYIFIDRIIKRSIKKSENIILNSFLKNKDAAIYKNKYFLSGKGSLDIFRDIIILKKQLENEKGVVLIKYTPTFDAFLAYFKIKEIFKNYYIVLEPSWAGYCDPSILMFIISNNKKNNVIVQSPENSDFNFIKRLGTNLLPIDIGSADWVDKDVFAPSLKKNKIYDLVMVANWGSYKRHKELFKALKRIKNRQINLLLIGFEWDGRTKAHILNEYHQILNGSKTVILTVLENLSAKDLSNYLCKSKVFILLSQKEGPNKALVEAFFCNIPAIVYDRMIGGARNKINSKTGMLSSYNDLPKKIEYMLDNYQNYASREWALKNTGSFIATNVLNQLVKKIAKENGEAMSTNIVEKTNTPNLSYKDPSMRMIIEKEYREIEKASRY